MKINRVAWILIVLSLISISFLIVLQVNSETALASLKTAAAIYTRLGDTVGSLGNAINQAQVLQAAYISKHTSTLNKYSKV